MWGNIIGTAILFVLMVILFRLWEDRRTGGAVLVPMVRCNICGYPYHGLAMDCFCTMCPSCYAVRKDDRREGCSDRWHNC